MANHKLLSVSIIILAICMLTGMVYIGHTLQALDFYSDHEVEEIKESGLITMSEAADYLNLSLSEFERLVLLEEKEKELLSVYSTHRFISYIEISSNKKLFSKIDLDKWIEYNLHNK